MIETVINCLIYAGDDTTPSYMAMIVSHHKDPQGNDAMVLNAAHINFGAVGTKRIGLRGGFLETRSLHLIGLLFQTLT